MSFERVDCNGRTYRSGEEVRCTCVESGNLRLENKELREKLVMAQTELGLRHSRIVNLDAEIKSLHQRLERYEPPNH